MQGEHARFLLENIWIYARLRAQSLMWEAIVNRTQVTSMLIQNLRQLWCGTMNMPWLENARQYTISLPAIIFPRGYLRNMNGLELRRDHVYTS